MTSSTCYALCNEAHAPELTVTLLSTWVVDLQDAYDGPFGSTWGILPVIVALGIPANNGGCTTLRIVHLVDVIPEAPGALAYHTVDAQGSAVLRIGVETIRQNLQSGQVLEDEITKAISHELFETAIDAPAVLYCYVDGKAVMLALEVCDPVQGGAWKQGSTVMSNYVTEDYFDAANTSKVLDKCGQLTAPLSCAPDGYQAWSDGTQTFGASMSLFKQMQVSQYGRRVRKWPREAPTGRGERSVS